MFYKFQVCLAVCFAIGQSGKFSSRTQEYRNILIFRYGMHRFSDTPAGKHHIFPPYYSRKAHHNQTTAKLEGVVISFRRHACIIVVRTRFPVSRSLN